jgi:type I restriction enzyme S subunit
MVEEKVREGYRRTEIGIIPEDWEVKTFKDILDYEQPGKYIVYSDIKEKGTTKVLTANKSFVLGFTDESYGIYKKVPVIIFDDFTTMSKLVKEPFKVKSSAIKILKEKDSKSDITYIYNLMQIINYPLGNHKRYYLSEYQYQNIMLPPIKEQTAIAEVLSDIDDLITTLQKLIDKKEKIKKGAMQKLLTGKERLPGFAGDWEEKELKDICETITTGKLDANAMKKNGEYRFYTCAKNYYMIDKYAFDKEALLVSGNGANVGYIHYYKGKFNAYQRTYVLYGFSEDIIYIKVFLEKNLNDRINKEKNAGNTPYIKKDTLENMKVKIPPMQEQKAIAQILSDMDSEIEALNKKLEKYKKIKQGMMEELLTGRIRLV